MNMAVFEKAKEQVLKHFEFNDEKFKHLKNMWDKAGFSDIKNQKIANYVFDFAVETNEKESINILKQAFNLLNTNFKLELDGFLSIRDVETINNYSFYKSLFKTLIILQGAYLIDLIHKKQRDVNFFRMWVDKKR
jgi:lysozyme family protein